MTNDITDAYLDGITKYCEKATPGPFLVGPDAGVKYQVNGTIHARNRALALVMNESDLELFRNARTDLPRLVAALKETQRAVTEANWSLSNHVDAGGGTKSLLEWANAIYTDTKNRRSLRDRMIEVVKAERLDTEQSRIPGTYAYGYNDAISDAITALKRLT